MVERILESSTTTRLAPLPVFVNQPGGADNDLHELRVRIPHDLHRQLLSLKVLRGKSLAETVSSALEAYFAARMAAIQSSHAEETHQERAQEA